MVAHALKSVAVPLVRLKVWRDFRRDAPAFGRVRGNEQAYDVRTPRRLVTHASRVIACKLNDLLTGHSGSDFPIPLGLLWFNQLPVVLEHQIAICVSKF